MMEPAISFSTLNSGIQAGINNGAINTEIHHHATRPETPPSPSILIPSGFSRDENFVKVGTLLKEIHEKCAVPGSRTALAGLGGVGKSQLAIEYAYQTRDKSLETWVFWIHSSNRARFEESFRNIANRVKIPGRNDPQADLIQLVHDWLCNERKGKWLLILDNVDDAAFLVEVPKVNEDGRTRATGGGCGRPLKDYLPQCQHGSILVTTRNEDAARELVEQRDIIKVEPMKSADAVTLLRTKLGPHDDVECTVELAEVLGGMPLAIVMAAAYITLRAPLCSVSAYLENFKSEPGAIERLVHEDKQMRRDREAKNSIINTWRISFEHIRRTAPPAADLLSLMCFFDRQGIPDFVLQDRVNKDGVSQHGTRGIPREKFENAVKTLRDYSFISVDSDGKTFGMHALVQLATRTWLKTYKTLETWKDKFIEILEEEFPEGEFEDWDTCQMLSPHVQAAVAQKPEEAHSLLLWSSIMYNAGYYALAMGKYAEAERLALEALKINETIRGSEHHGTLAIMSFLGCVYSEQRRWEVAISMCLSVLGITKSKGNTNSSLTVATMAVLARVYYGQRHWDDAEKLQLEVLGNLRTALGPNHRDTLNNMSNLASTYQKQGRWDMAGRLEVELLECYRTFHSPNHPDTLCGMIDLGATYYAQGRWADAEKLQLEVLESRKTILGPNHPDTLLSMNNLACTWKEMGRYTEAIELMEKCVRLGKIGIGPDHPHAIQYCEVLARWKAKRERNADPGQGGDSQGNQSQRLRQHPRQHESLPPWIEDMVKELQHKREAGTLRIVDVKSALEPPEMPKPNMKHRVKSKVKTLASHLHIAR